MPGAEPNVGLGFESRTRHWLIHPDAPKEAEIFLEEIMAENFSDQGKETDIQTRGSRDEPRETHTETHSS